MHGADATKHYFGWAHKWLHALFLLVGAQMAPCTILIGGRTNGSMHYHVKCLRTSILSELEDLDSKFNQWFSKKCIDDENLETVPSIDDILWEEMVLKSLQKPPINHIEVGLPFRDSHHNMPNNYSQVYNRIKNLKFKL